jgi:hypothetical protein
MPLSWNEIKDRALCFSREWQHESSEDAECLDATLPGAWVKSLKGRLLLE